MPRSPCLDRPAPPGQVAARMTNRKSEAAFRPPRRFSGDGEAQFDARTATPPFRAPRGADVSAWGCAGRTCRRADEPEEPLGRPPRLARVVGRQPGGGVVAGG